MWKAHILRCICPRLGLAAGGQEVPPTFLCPHAKAANYANQILVSGERVPALPDAIEVFLPRLSFVAADVQKKASGLSFVPAQKGNVATEFSTTNTRVQLLAFSCDSLSLKNAMASQLQWFSYVLIGSVWGKDRVSLDGSTVGERPEMPSGD